MYVLCKIIYVYHREKTVWKNYKSLFPLPWIFKKESLLKRLGGPRVHVDMDKVLKF